MVYGLKYTGTFKKQIDRVKKRDGALMEELMKKVRKLRDAPYSGKPPKHRLSQYRSLRVKGKYRLIYMGGWDCKCGGAGCLWAQGEDL